MEIACVSCVERWMPKRKPPRKLPPPSKSFINQLYRQFSRDFDNKSLPLEAGCLYSLAFGYAVGRKLNTETATLFAERVVGRR